MQVSELLESTTPFTYMKGLQKKFKEIAADAGLVWVAGMGWPQIMKDGFWFGGGLKATSRDAGNIVRVSELPLDALVDVALKGIAAELEQAMEAGHTVMVANADRTSSKKAVEKGKALQALKSTIKTMVPPGSQHEPLPTITFYISAPEGMADTETIRMDIYGNAPQGGSINLSYGTTLPKKQARQLVVWWHGVYHEDESKRKASWAQENYFYKNDRLGDVVKTKDFEDFVKRVGSTIQHIEGIDPSKFRHFDVRLKLKTLNKRTKLVPKETFEKIFSQFPGFNK